MRKARPFILLGIALFTAIASSSYVYQWLQNAALRASASGQGSVEVVQQQIETTKVAVAAIDIPWGEKLTPEMVTLVDFPSDYLPEGFHQTSEALDGRVAREGIRKNEPFLEAKLVPTDAETGGVAAVMDPFMRAMSVRVDDEIGVAGFLKPADRVDVFVSLKGREIEDTITKLVLENTRVLAIGTEMVRVGPDSEPRPVKVVTLEVNAEDGEKLALGATQGKFRLALRHPLDQEETLTRGATRASLLASNRLPGDAQAASTSKFEIQVIKGGELSTVSF